MSKPQKPSEENGFLWPHVAILRDSYRRWTGRDLVSPRMIDREAARYLFSAPFAVASHDATADPIFNYANQTALNLFAMSWEEFTALPSRMSAEPGEQGERERLLREVAANGFVDDYRGVRIGRHGRRFLIEDVVIWNLVGPADGVHLGQAAMIKNWKFL